MGTSTSSALIIEQKADRSTPVCQPGCSYSYNASNGTLTCDCDVSVIRCRDDQGSLVWDEILNEPKCTIGDEKKKSKSWMWDTPVPAEDTFSRKRVEMLLNSCGDKYIEKRQDPANKRKQATFLSRWLGGNCSTGAATTKEGSVCAGRCRFLLNHAASSGANARAYLHGQLLFSAFPDRVQAIMDSTRETNGREGNTDKSPIQWALTLNKEHGGELDFLFWSGQDENHSDKTHRRRRVLTINKDGSISPLPLRGRATDILDQVGLASWMTANRVSSFANIDELAIRICPFLVGPMGTCVERNNSNPTTNTQGRLIVTSRVNPLTTGTSTSSIGSAMAPRMRLPIPPPPTDTSSFIPAPRIRLPIPERIDGERVTMETIPSKEATSAPHVHLPIPIKNQPAPSSTQRKPPPPPPPPPRPTSRS